MKRLRQNKSPLVSHSRWLAYAAAGAATTLAGAQSAEAEIHYSGLVKALFPHGIGFKTFPLDQPDDYLAFAGAYGFRLTGAFVGTATLDDADVRALRSGRYVSTAHFVYPVYTYGNLNDPHFFSPFCSPKFIGFRFRTGSGLHYGWVRVCGKQSTFDFKVIDYAWADPGEPIKTGQTSSTGDQVEAEPDQGSLGMLALGGAGLMAWRKRRAKVD